jgi:hypothetical protein
MEKSGSAGLLMFGGVALAILMIVMVLGIS